MLNILHLQTLCRRGGLGLLLLAVLSLQGCEDTNLLLLTSAGMDALSAVTMSDEDVHLLARKAAAEADASHQLADASSPHARRLESLVAGHRQRDGHRFDFRVYRSDRVNAFAMADGTVRVYSGLMEMMNDTELLFVIGHEMGHVVKNHSRRKVVVAYASSAVRKGLAAQQNEIGQLAASVIGALSQQLINAQFSQHEERQADNYGAAFLVELGHGIEPAVSALGKLDRLAQQHTFLSSHPDPAARAERLASGAYLRDDVGEPSFWVRLYATLKSWLLALVRFVARFF